MMRDLDAPIPPDVALVNGTNGVGGAQLGRVSRASSAPLVQSAEHTQIATPERYLADRFRWAAPGDQQEDAWLVRFCDRECGEAVFTGPDAERDAWAHWERYAPSFNIYVFRLAALDKLVARPA